MGWPQPVEKIAQFCKQRGILLIEDCALALFSSLDSRRLGAHGDFSIFCLYKTLPLPHGGLLVQNNQELPRLSIDVGAPDGISVAGRLSELLLESLHSQAAPPASF